MTLEDLSSLVVGEQIPPDTQVREDDSAEWQPAYQALGLEVEPVDGEQSGAPEEPAPHLQPHLVATDQPEQPHLQPHLPSTGPVQPAVPLEAAPPQAGYVATPSGPVTVQPGYPPVQTGAVPQQPGYVPGQPGPIPPQTGWVLTQAGYVPVQTGPVPVGYAQPGAPGMGTVPPGERRITGLGLPFWVIILIGALAMLLGGLGVLRWKQIKDAEDRGKGFGTSITEELTSGIEAGEGKEPAEKEKEKEAEKDPAGS